MTKKPTIEFRSASINSQKTDETKREIEVSFASEEPYERDFGFEILDCSPAGADLRRLNSGGPLLRDHDHKAQIGVVTKAWLDQDGTARARLRFSKRPEAEHEWQDVVDGIRSKISVGYEVTKMTESGKRKGVPVYRCQWTAFEVSTVSIPADDTVGVGRKHSTPIKKNSMKPTALEIEDDESADENLRTRSQELQRREGISDLANHMCDKGLAGHNSPDQKSKIRAIAAECLSRNKTEADFRAAVMDTLFPQQAASDFGGSEDDRRLMSGGLETRSVGEQIVSHRDFSRLSEGGRKLISFELKHVRSFREFSGRAAVMTGSVGLTIDQLQAGAVQGVAFERLAVADLILPGGTGAGKITYPREVSFESDAAPVAEGATKPEQAFDLEPAEAAVKKIAAWTKISDELLADSPATAAYINARLGFAVQKTEDYQLLQGNGTGANTRGFLNTPGLQTQAKGADTILDAIRKAIGKVDIGTDFIADGIVLHPSDWQAIELMKDTANRYLVGQVVVPDEFGNARRAPALWGLPIAVSKSMLAGTALVGAFRSASQLFRRTGLLIEMTNSNEDDFIKNLLTIRAELRAALAVYAPGAFTQVTGLAD